MLRIVPSPSPQPQALLQNENISNVPFLVLGNKIDRPEAISEGALRGAFGIDNQVTGKVNTWTLVYTTSDCNRRVKLQCTWRSTVFICINVDNNLLETSLSGRHTLYVFCRRPSTI